jgi:apolipoprotein N-acyltransferase
VLFSALWLLAELARGVWLTGFGWGATAYAHPDGPLAQYAPWLGAYGVGALAAWLAMVLAQLLAGPPWPLRCGLLVSAILMLSLPTFVRQLVPDLTQSSGRLMVTLLQGNIPQDEKFETGSGVPLALQWYGEQLQKANTALVVAPETALPLLPHQLPRGYWTALQDHFAEGRQAALIGIPLGNFEEGYTNSVVGLRPGAERPWRYDKHHLVPFGEFIPPWFKWFTELMNIPLGDFTRGGLGQSTFQWQGQRLAANICYEDLFGEELAQQFHDADQAPTILVNVSNLAWFGGSLAMDQHLQIARWRALEFARPFLLSTNTGVTAIVDHQARVLQTLPRDTRGVLVGEVEGQTGLTPYAWWVSRLGLWPCWLAGLAIVLVSWRRLLRKR